MSARGHSRDCRSDKRQITYGLLCDREGCPVAIKLFKGNAADPSTVDRQVDNIRRRFALGRVALMDDRGMITSARIREELNPAGLDWIFALRSCSPVSLHRLSCRLLLVPKGLKAEAEDAADEWARVDLACVHSLAAEYNRRFEAAASGTVF